MPDRHTVLDWDTNPHTPRLYFKPSPPLSAPLPSVTFFPFLKSFRENRHEGHAYGKRTYCLPPDHGALYVWFEKERSTKLISSVESRRSFNAIALCKLREHSYLTSLGRNLSVAALCTSGR